MPELPYPARSNQPAFLHSIVTLMLVLTWLLTACSSQSTAGNASQPTTTSTATTQATLTAMPATATPTATQQQSWQTYQSPYFTLQYPTTWIANVIPQGTQGGIYVQQVEFRPSSTSPISFTVSPMINQSTSPDTLLQNDILVQHNKVEAQGNETINGLTWSTATISTQGSQLAVARIEVAYANHLHPYRVSFGTPPDQFDKNSVIFNTMFQSFQEK